MGASERREHVEALVLRAVRGLTSGDALSTDTPLMEAGVDSLAATELSSSLRAATELPLSPTLLFEQPTARAIIGHILELTGRSAASAAAPQSSEPLGTSSSPIQMLGDAARCPQ